jgi:hypothetical protein
MRYRKSRSQKTRRVHALPQGPVSQTASGPCVTARTGVHNRIASMGYRNGGVHNRIGSIRHRMRGVHNRVASMRYRKGRFPKPHSVHAVPQRPVSLTAVGPFGTAPAGFNNRVGPFGTATAGLTNRVGPCVTATAGFQNAIASMRYHNGRSQKPRRVHALPQGPVICNASRPCVTGRGGSHAIRRVHALPRGPRSPLNRAFFPPAARSITYAAKLNLPA